MQAMISRISDKKIDMITTLYGYHYFIQFWCMCVCFFAPSVHSVCFDAGASGSHSMSPWLKWLFLIVSQNLWIETIVLFLAFVISVGVCTVFFPPTDAGMCWPLWWIERRFSKCYISQPNSRYESNTPEKKKPATSVWQLIAWMCRMNGTHKKLYTLAWQIFSLFLCYSSLSLLAKWCAISNVVWIQTEKKVHIETKTKKKLMWINRKKHTHKTLSLIGQSECARTYIIRYAYLLLLLLLWWFCIVCAMWSSNLVKYTRNSHPYNTYLINKENKIDLLSLTASVYRNKSETSATEIETEREKTENVTRKEKPSNWLLKNSHGRFPYVN